MSENTTPIKYGITDIAPAPERKQELTSFLLKLPQILTGLQTLCILSGQLPQDSQIVKEIQKLCKVVNLVSGFGFGSTEDAPIPLQPQELNLDWATQINFASLIQEALQTVEDLKEGKPVLSPPLDFAVAGYDVEVRAQLTLKDSDEKESK